MFTTLRHALIGAGTLAFLVAGSGAKAQTASTDYRLHSGDKLDISVWKEEEMQKPGVVVSPDGRISFPLAGQIMAAGRTVGEIRQDIEARLKTYIPDPVVSISIADTGGNIAYVIGQVGKPGGFPLNPRINVLQALSLAGGGTPFAKLDSIIIVRGSQGQRVLPFHFSQVSAGKNLEQNVMLESGDVIVVP
jgi:polysaccharide export outer membrane protein